MIFLYILLGLIVSLLVFLLVDLRFAKWGLGFTWAEAPGGPLTFRIRRSHWMPKYFRKSKTAVMAVFFNVLVAQKTISAWWVSHEVGHIVRARQIGHWTYLFKYVTDSKFRANEEIMCDEFAKRHFSDPLFKTIATLS